MLSMLAMSAAILAAGQTGQEAQEKQTQVVEKSDGQNVPSPPKIRVVDIPTPPPIMIAAPPPPPPPPPAFVPPPAPAPSLAKGVEPRGNPGRWVPPYEYPEISMLTGEEGTTGFLLEVGANGRVNDCSITRSSGSSRLDERACRSLERRARFRPALDNAGEPVSGYYRSAVRWVVVGDSPLSYRLLRWSYPDEAASAEQEGVVGFRITIASDGSVSDCQITSSSGSAALDAATCTNLRRIDNVMPGQDASGRPVSRTHEGEVSWVRENPEGESEE